MDPAAAVHVAATGQVPLGHAEGGPAAQRGETGGLVRQVEVDSPVV